MRKSVAKQRIAARSRVVKIARSKVGSQYRWGGTGPWGFDCSGLVHYSYRKATGKTLPRTAASQNYGTRNVKRQNLKRGDLVFFNGNSHVAVYIGHNKVVHATNPRSGVRVDSLSGYWGPRINGMGRVIVKR